MAAEVKEYLLLESGDKILLENDTGALLLEQVPPVDIDWNVRPALTGNWTVREDLADGG